MKTLHRDRSPLRESLRQPRSDLSQKRHSSWDTKRTAFPCSCRRCVPLAHPVSHRPSSLPCWDHPPPEHPSMPPLPVCLRDAPRNGFQPQSRERFLLCIRSLLFSMCSLTKHFNSLCDALRLHLQFVRSDRVCPLVVLFIGHHVLLDFGFVIQTSVLCK